MLSASKATTLRLVSSHSCSLGRAMMRNALHAINGAPTTATFGHPTHIHRLNAYYSKGQVENGDVALEDTTHQLGRGSIELILGPMFSGKTTELINTIETAQKAGRKVVAIKSAIDTRYAATSAFRSFMVCHSGGRVECYSVSSLAQVKEHFSEEYNGCDVIAIDEAQFFPDLVEFCKTAADIDGKRLCVAGLDGDYLRHPFELPCGTRPIVDLLPISDKVTKKLAKCKFCDRDAPFTFRSSHDSEEILVGGGELYFPVCRHHYHIKTLEKKIGNDVCE